LLSSLKKASFKQWLAEFLTNLPFGDSVKVTENFVKELSSISFYESLTELQKDQHYFGQLVDEFCYNAGEFIFEHHHAFVDGDSAKGQALRQELTVLAKRAELLGNADELIRVRDSLDQRLEEMLLKINSAAAVAPSEREDAEKIAKSFEFSVKLLRKEYVNLNDWTF